MTTETAHAAPGRAERLAGYPLLDALDPAPIAPLRQRHLP